MILGVAGESVALINDCYVDVWPKEAEHIPKDVWIQYKHRTSSSTKYTYSMEQSPSWEAYRFSASQEIPRILWNSKIHYRIHKCPPPVPILNASNEYKSTFPVRVWN